MVHMSQQQPGVESGSEAELRARPSSRARGRRGNALGSDGLGAAGREILERTVAQDVIPLLVAMPWVRPAAPPESRRCVLDAGTVAQLVTLCLDPDARGVATFVAGLHDRGVAAESLYVDLLTPAARRLGDMWAEDECSFVETTIGVLRLQNAQRALAPGFVGEPSASVGAPRALLMPVPGEQHTFGLSMVVDFFCRAGWDARVDVFATDAQALRVVAAERADLIGLSFACDERVKAAERLIAGFRRVSSNPNLVVMVGGPSFLADPALAARVGADGTAADGHQAAVLAHALVHRISEPAQAAGGARS